MRSLLEYGQSYDVKEKWYAEQAEELRMRIEPRLQDTELMPLEKDRQYARELFDFVEAGVRYDERSISPSERAEFLAALDLLVPSWSEEDATPHKIIRGKKVTEGKQRLIDSRLEAKEVAFEDHLWSKLPKNTRKHIVATHPFTMEGTTECTGGCTFCGVAVKGPIKSKLSFDTIKQILGDYSLYRSRESPRLDTFYYNTDPFDIKYILEDGTEIDYSDISNYHQRTTTASLYTSTTIPLAEELRVLEYLDQVAGLQLPMPEKLHRLKVRLSKSSNNEEAVDAIDTIMSLRHGTTYKSSSGISITENINDRAHIAGAHWNKPDISPELTDIVGIGCDDTVIISPSGVHMDLMTAGSRNHPSGSYRRSILQPSPSGSMYCIPDYSHVADLREYTSNEAYPPVWTTRFDQHGNGISREIFANPPDTLLPARAMLQLSVIAYQTLRELYALTSFPQDLINFSHEKVLARLRPEQIELVEAHIHDPGFEVWKGVLSNITRKDY